MKDNEGGVPEGVRDFNAFEQAETEAEMVAFQEKLATKAGDWFDSESDPAHRVDMMARALEPFCEHIGEEGKAVSQNVRELESELDRDRFIGRFLEATQPIVEIRRSNRDQFERILQQSSEIMSDRRFLSDLLTMENEVHDGEVRLHLYDTSDLRKYGEASGIKKSKMVLADLERGLKNLAKIVEANPDIQRVNGYSWLVAKQPALFERYGFVVDAGGPTASTKPEGRPKQGATISREELLRRFLKED